MKKLLVISGGGTGGHVFPALAVAERLADEFELCWIGSRSGIEYRIVSERGIRFCHVPSGKLRRYFSLRNVIDLFKIAAGCVASLFVLARLRPAALFSKGGFVTVPPVLAARILRIPVISHESDFDPGLATRINARSSAAICLPYAATVRFFAPAMAPRLVHTGNPVREDIFRGRGEIARSQFCIPAGKRLLFVQGGSLGARQINQLVADLLPGLGDDWAVIHQRGEGDWDLPDQAGRYCSRPFFGAEYAHILAAADLVLSRAGAGSIWEMGVMAKPGILLPLSAGSRGDQLRNARACAEAGACIVLSDDDALPQLANFMAGLADRAAAADRLDAMARAWSGLILLDGADRVAAVVRRVARREALTGMVGAS